MKWNKFLKKLGKKNILYNKNKNKNKCKWETLWCMNENEVFLRKTEWKQDRDENKPKFCHKKTKKLEKQQKKQNGKYHGAL